MKSKQRIIHRTLIRICARLSISKRRSCNDLDKQIKTVGGQLANLNSGLGINNSYISMYNMYIYINMHVRVCVCITIFVLYYQLNARGDARIGQPGGLTARFERKRNRQYLFTTDSQTQKKKQ